MRLGDGAHSLPPMAITRREFLAAGNAAAMLFLLESCSLGSIGRSGATPAGQGGSPYDVALKLLRDALAASPDHLARRAADAVAGRDAAKIVEFVRSQVAVIPPLLPSDDASTARRWGSRATLRSGLGTLRDRAELLAELLTQAGFKAQVQVAARPSSLTAEATYAARPARFAPDAGRVNQARSAVKAGRFPAPPAAGTFDAGPDPVAAMAAALPASVQAARTRSDLLPATVPVVVFDDKGKTRYAVAVGDVGLVDSPPANLTARAADAMRQVSFTVSAVCNPGLGGTTPRGRLVDLATASWPADQVVGRQVLLTFQPPQGGKAMLDSGLASLPVRAPILRVQGADRLVAFGSAITLSGDVLGPPGATTTDGPFGSLKPLAAAGKPAALARVKSISVRANAAAFPDVELAISLRDAAGASVDGLDAASLTVKEEGKPVGAFTLYSNTAVQPRPRVLVIYDAYVDFAPKLFPSAEAKLAFESALATAISEQAAKTPFDVQVVSLGAPPDAGSWAAPSASALSARFAAAAELADDPWGSAAGAALEQGVAAIVMVSDFDSSDTDPNLLPTWKRRLTASGVPVFAIPVGTVDPGGLDAIVAVTNGARVEAADLSPLPGLLGAVASKWVSPGYRVRYRAQAGDPAQRTVGVGVAAASGTATYTVPSSPVPPPAFSGLYVTIAFGSLTARRRIAGLQLSPSGAPLGALDDPAAVAETRAALNGVTTISIEGGTPTAAAIFDDICASMQSMSALESLGAKPTSDQVIKAARNVSRTPLTLAPLLREVPVDAGAPIGLRVAILQDRAVTASALEQHADLAVGLNEVVALASDGGPAFRAALKTSVAMAGAEAATYADSAYKRLSGQRLTAVVAGDGPALAAWLKAVPAAGQAAWSALFRVYADYHLALPADASAAALWAISPTTGVAHAVLLDGSGGGEGGGGGGKCHISGEDGEALALAAMALECSAAGEEWPIFCTSVNTMASGMCVIQLFEGKGDYGTPVGAIQPWLGLGEAGLGWLDAQIGMMLMLITLSEANCI